MTITLIGVSRGSAQLLEEFFRVTSEGDFRITSAGDFRIAYSVNKTTRDFHSLHPRCAIIYNTDVADSQLIAEYYANECQIPTENLFGYAFGTNPQSVSATSLTYAGFWTDLYNHVTSINKCSAVFCAAGVPNLIRNVPLQTDLQNTTGYIHLPICVTAVKQIYASGLAPATHNFGSGQWYAYDASQSPSTALEYRIVPNLYASDTSATIQNWIGIPHSLNATEQLYTNVISPVLSNSHQPKYVREAILAAGEDPDDLLWSWFTYLTTTARDRGDYSDTRRLLNGYIGPWSQFITSWPSNLFESAQRIIDDATRYEKRKIGSLIGQPILWGLGASGGSYNTLTPAWYDAWGPRQFREEGWPWESLVLWDGGYGYSSSEITETIIDPSYLISGDPGDLTDQAFFVFGGGGVQNSKWDITESDEWISNINPLPGSVSIGGRSDSQKWASTLIDKGAVAGLGAWIHETAQTLNWTPDAVHQLLKGFSMAEIALDSPPNYFCMGDPLYRPISAD